ncbi:MAG: hypothetical protein ACKOXR_04110 [Bacteroidota bacterium]
MKNKIIVLIFLLVGKFLSAQNTNVGLPNPDKQKPTLEFHALNQVWLRANQSNPGTTVLSEAANQTVDLGLRRTRFQVFGEVAPKVFLYFQAGQNNVNRMTNLNGNRKNTFFIHDALCEYAAFGNKLKLGGGLTIANGLSRFSQPSISSILALDVPVFAQATVDQTDQFSRKLSAMARGQIGHWDYRIVMSDPFPIQSNGNTAPTLGNNASFATKGHHWQQQAMLTYQFFEQEQHLTPYMPGTYLGSKKVWNISVGGIYQKNATWSLQSNGPNAPADTLYHPLLLGCVESFLDMPINAAVGNAIHAYLGYFYTNYGANYLRYNGIMNPANGMSQSGLATEVGGQYGNAYPMFGTGHVWHAQVAYLLPKDFLGKEAAHGKLQCYATATGSKYTRLNNKQLVIGSLGVNWQMPGNRSKITLDLSNRPAVALYNSNSFTVTRKNAFTLQYQINI